MRQQVVLTHLEADLAAALVNGQHDSLRQICRSPSQEVRAYLAERLRFVRDVLMRAEGVVMRSDVGEVSFWQEVIEKSEEVKSLLVDTEVDKKELVELIKCMFNGDFLSMSQAKLYRKLILSPYWEPARAAMVDVVLKSASPSHTKSELAVSAMPG